MNGFSDERGAEMRQLFFETSQELLQSLNDDTLKLEKQPGDLETVRSLRRTVHTMKGDAAACGFHELSELAHELEDALAVENPPSTVSMAEIAFTAADTFEAMLGSYRGHTALPSAEPLRELIRALTKGQEASPTTQARKSVLRDNIQPVWNEQERLLIQSALRQERRVCQVIAHLDPLCAMPIAARQLILNALSSLGQVLAAVPAASLPQSVRSLPFVLATSRPVEDLIAKCRIPTVTSEIAVEELTIEELKTAPAGNAQAKSPSPTTLESPASVQESDEHQLAPSLLTENFLRVDARRVDSLLNLVGELIIGKSMLQQTLSEFGRRYPKDPLRARLADSLAFQSRVLTDLQHSVMKVRMVPVEQLFRRFPRIVRDVARQCGKQAELVVQGQDTDLDRSLLDAIAEPLTHLIRNAVSHGLEPAEDRTRQGKPACGTVRLAAFHQGNQVVVEVSDDGCGIDLQRVKAKAIEQKLVTSEQSAALSESEILGMLFRSGFSTALEVSEISGRGVGLDVVHSVLQRLKGSVEIVNRPGQGTCFRLKLPLTLAIIKALLFRVENRLYAIALNAVDEIARARECDVHRVEAHEVLQLRGQALQLVRLGKIRNEVAQNPRSKIFILVIDAGDQKLGLIIDSLEGEEELVIKAIDDQTVDTDLVSGASILGDGRVVLVLNLASVVRRSRQLASDEQNAAGGMLLLEAERKLPNARAAGGGQ